MLKKTIGALGLFFLSLTVLAQGGLRYTIQVYKFENRAGWSSHWDLGDAWGAVLTDKLTQGGDFIVVGEQDMRGAAMDEQDLGASGRTAGGGKTPVAGQMTPAQLLVKGAITAFDDGTGGGSTGGSYKGVSLRLKGSKATITGVVYVVDATTGVSVASYNFEEEVKSGGVKVGLNKGGFAGDVGGFKKTPAGKVMDQACDKIASFLGAQAANIPWSATVVKGGDDRIIINRGSREGVSSGQTFRVGQAEDVRDPDTGELLDSDFKETGKIQITEVKEKLSYAKLASGKAPKKGDKVYQ